jgi:hypothetical protein
VINISSFTLRTSPEEDRMISELAEKLKINTKSKTLKFCLKKTWEIFK